MNQQIKEYLANYYKTKTSDIDLLLQKELATSFLLIWPIFEQTLFDGFCNQTNLSRISEKSIFLNCYNEFFEHFYTRYQDKQKYHNLKHNDKSAFTDSILNKKY